MWSATRASSSSPRVGAEKRWSTGRTLPPGHVWPEARSCPVDPDARPESVLMRAKRLGLIVSRLPSLESGDAPRLTAVAVEDLLLRPSENIDHARLEALVIVPDGGRRTALDRLRRAPTRVSGPALVAALCAAATTFFAVKFLLRFFETNRLTPFGIYCISIGLVSTLVFAFGG